jgi:anaerobic selenocysteine-containing dehydrogenase
MVASRFAKAMGGRYLGFEAIDNLTYRVALRNVFGQDLLPDFDLEHANYLLSFGADFLSTWVSPTRWARGYGEFRQGVGRERRGILVQVEPRFSMTAANADKWVPIKPGMEGYLALSLAYVILSENRQAEGVDVMALTEGRGAAALEAFRPEAVAGKIGLPPGFGGVSPAEFIRRQAREFADPKHRPSLAIGGGEAAAHSNGLFNLEAIYTLNYLVGSVGTAGGIRFNPGSPLPGLPAAAEVGSLGDWFGVSKDVREGKIRLLMVHGADPVQGLPGSVGFGDALNREDLFVVSFSPFMDDTTVMADLVLPDRVYLEDWGDDIPEPGPGYQVIGIQQPVVNPLRDFDPRSFPDVLLSMAQELGRDADLPWDNFQQVLREASDALFALNRGSVQATSREEFWTRLLRQGGWWDHREVGPTSITRPNLSTIAAKAAEPQFPGSPAAPFYLMPFLHNTLLDGRGAHLPWLQATPDPLTTIAWQTWVEINDRKAREMGLREGDIVRVESSRGSSIRALVYPNPAMPPDLVAVPLGQGRTVGSLYARGRGENVMNILEPNQVEGTGALAWANTKVTVVKTGDSVKVSKFEGIIPEFGRAVEIGHTLGEQIIRTITPEGT